MLFPELEKKLERARLGLKRADSENIVRCCKQYIELLAEYRDQIYKLRGCDDLDQSSASTSAPETVANTRKAVRVALETTMRERNRIELLLRSFTMISGFEAAEIFNRLKYQGHDDWELRASGIRSGANEPSDPITIQRAVEIASLLRREEYLAQVHAESDKTRASTEAQKLE